MDGKKNVVADVLSWKPQVFAVSIVFHDELEEMKKEYAYDEEFSRIYDQLEGGIRHKHYSLKDGFLLMHGRICVKKSKKRKIMEESHNPPYSGHRGIKQLVRP